MSRSRRDGSKTIMGRSRPVQMTTLVYTRIRTDIDKRYKACRFPAVPSNAVEFSSTLLALSARKADLLTPASHRRSESVRPSIIIPERVVFCRSFPRPPGLSLHTACRIPWRASGAGVTPLTPPKRQVRDDRVPARKRCPRSTFARLLCI